MRGGETASDEEEGKKAQIATVSAEVEHKKWIIDKVSAIFVSRQR